MTPIGLESVVSQGPGDREAGSRSITADRHRQTASRKHFADGRLTAADAAPYRRKEIDVAVVDDIQRLRRVNIELGDIAARVA